MINFVKLYIYISKKNVYEWFYECNISKKKNTLIMITAVQTN